MNKLLLSAVAVLAAVSVANAEPRFGVVAYQGSSLGNGTAGTNGVAPQAGLFVTDDVYNASVTFSSFGKDADNTSTQFAINAAYKLAVDSTTAWTVGVGYSNLTGKTATVAHGEDSAVDLTLGVQKSLASNVDLVADTAAYRSAKVAGSNYAGFFSAARVGVAVLF